jgi:hypothetical protein
MEWFYICILAILQFSSNYPLALKRKIVKDSWTFELALAYDRLFFLHLVEALNAIWLGDPILKIF